MPAEGSLRPELGYLAAGGAAACWGVCSLFFAAAGRRIGALAVNQVRIALAVLALLLLHLLVHGSLWPQASAGELALLSVSGVIGLALGDFFYFYSLAVVGPRLGTLLMATWPVLAVLLAWAFRGEGLTPAMAGGVGATTLGVALVLLRPDDGGAWNPEATRRARWLAVGAGLLGALGQAGGIVLAVQAMAPDAARPDGFDRLSATLLRMAAGLGGALLLAAASGKLRGLGRALGDRRGLGLTAAGAVFGPVLGVWLSLVAVHHAPTGAASALMATTPVLMLPLARLVYGARIGALGIAGTLVAVMGTVLLVGSG